MKKLIALTLCLALVLSFSFAAMAATSTTVYDSGTGVFTTTVTADVGDQATLIAFPASGLDTTGSTNIEFIDQATTTAGATVFTYKFKNAVVPNQAYTIKVGGSLLATPLSETITPVVAATGYTVSGKVLTVGVTTYTGDETYDATLDGVAAVKAELFTVTGDVYDSSSTSAYPEVTVDKVSGLFSIEGVANGTYALKISRLGYLTRFIKVVVDGLNVDVGSKNLFAGQFQTFDLSDSSYSYLMVDGDDAALIWGSGTVDNLDITSSDYAPNSLFDINTDGMIDGADVGKLFQDIDTDYTTYGEGISVQ